MDLSAGRPDQAARLWKRFLESGGDRAAGHEGLADVHSAVMDYDTAAEELRRALSARPGDARLMKKLRGLSGK
jgi:Tfp pilus assembly protein PilF